MEDDNNNFISCAMFYNTISKDYQVKVMLLVNPSKSESFFPQYHYCLMTLKHEFLAGL